MFCMVTHRQAKGVTPNLEKFYNAGTAEMKTTTSTEKETQTCTTQF
jgi:hypothetical protein